MRAFGIRFGILDRPNLRKIHQGEIPRLGGVSIFIATLLPFSLFLMSPPLMTQTISESWLPFLGLALGCLIVFGVGIWDDLYRLSPGPKLAVECLAGAVAFAFGLKIDLITNPFGFQLNLAWLSGPATILWLVAVTNAINLADGIDGLAAGIVTFAAMILFFMTFATAHPLVAFIAVALAGSALGFLRYNFYPATIFLGDSGSLLLGFCLGGLSLWASEKSTITFAILIPIVTLGLPLADMIYAVLRRWSRGLPVKEADREHIHHKLLEMGLSQRPTVLLLYGVNIFLVALAGILLVTRNSLAALIVVFLGLALILGSRLLGYFRFSRLLVAVRQGLQNSQQVRYISFRTRQIARSFDKVPTLEGRWDLVQELFVDLEFTRAVFQSENSSYPSLTWFSLDHQEPSSAGEVTLAFRLTGDQGPMGSIQINWSQNRINIPPGTSRLVTLLSNEFCRRLPNNPSALPGPPPTT